MKFQPRILDGQVILITGASSGIGLATARRAAKRGARLILVSRNAEALWKIADDINSDGGTAIHVVADVADPSQLQNAANQGIEKFGRIDTWINNAGVSVYGKIRDVNLEDDKRLFETNFWGVVHGSRLAVEYLKNGGMLINVGSVLSDRAIPLQGMYSASKHAVQGFTDALRMEIEEEGLPIQVTLIKPSAIDTPYIQHAKNYLKVEPTNPPPVYSPDLVADTILHAVEHPAREYYVGGGGRLLAWLGKQAPGLMDLLMEKIMFRQQKTNRPAPPDANTLHNPGGDGEERGQAQRDHVVLETSVYNSLSRHPLMLLLGVCALGGVALLLMQNRKPEPRRASLRVAERFKNLWTDLSDGHSANGKH